MRTLGYALPLALLAAGCADPEAPQKCEDFRDRYCERQEELCPDVTEAECRGLFDAALDCDDAVDVADTYDDCLASVEELEACPDDLPLACAGAVWVEPTDEEED